MRRLVLAAAAAMMFVVAACGGSDSDSGSSSSGSGGQGGTLTLAPIVQAQPWDLKDAGLGNNAQYYQPVYDPLFRLDEKGEPTPNLATEWKYDKNQTELTLTLQEGIKFTDGTAFDAEAVKVNLENTKTGSNEAAGHLRAVKNVRVANPTTAVVTLSAPDPSLVANLGNVAGMMASPKAIKDGSIAKTPVGTGPYTLDAGATTSGSQYTFARNPDYWNADAFPFDKIVLKPLTDPTAILNALRSGQINGATLTSPKNIAPAQQAGLTINRVTPGDVGGVYIWDRGGTQVEALGNVKVRQALNYAFDKAAIIKTANQGYGKETTQVFNASGGAYDAALDSKYTYDPAKAKQMLAEAGYSDGFDVTIPDLSFAFPDAQAAMTQQLKDIGVRVKAERVAPDQIIPALLGAKYPMSYFTLASFRPWDTVVIELQKESLWNPFKYDDPKADELIKKAQQLPAGSEQDAILKELNAYTVDQAWNAPWYQVENAYATTKGIEVTPFVFAPVPPIYNFRPAA